MSGFARLAIKIPKEFDPSSISVEVRDGHDRGYYMRPTRPCRTGNTCEYTWPLDKLKQLNIPADTLWPIALIDNPDLRDWVLPVCLCASTEIGDQDILEFIFIPTRTVNLQYLLYGEDGTLVSTEQRSAHPAGVPLSIRFPIADKGSSAHTLTINHIAVAGGAAERYADTYRFFAGSPK